MSTPLTFVTKPTPVRVPDLTDIKPDSATSDRLIHAAGGVAVSSCRSCPFYAPAAEMKDTAKLPYFGACTLSGRLINDTAAKALPASELCPVQKIRERVAAIGTSLFTPPASPSPTLEESAFRFSVALRVFAAPTDPSFVSSPRYVSATAHLDGMLFDSTLRPDSCKRCVFFRPKSEAGEDAAGTPLARYDLCGKYGTLIKPGSRATTAAKCVSGIPAALAPGVTMPALPVLDIYRTIAGVASATTDMAASSATPPMSAYVPVIPVVASTATREAELKAMLTATVEPLEDFSGTVPAAPVAAAPVAAAPVAATPVAATPVAAAPVAAGTKALPARVSSTGWVCKADTYAMPDDLPATADGVVAIRSTSKTSNVIWLPHFSPEAFAPDVRRDIPAGGADTYFDHSDLLYRMAVAYVTDSVAALWGDAGVGKTEAVEHLARITGQPFTRISIKWATQVDDLIGRWTLRDGTMEWIDGRFTQAWRAPYVICVDEPNTGKDEVWQALRAPFDGAQELVLDEKDGERIPRNGLARVFTAMNPGWDARFSGTRPLNDADTDRMQHIAVPYPPEDIERKIIMAKCAPSVTADAERVTAVLNTAKDIRSAVQARTIRMSFGMRKVIRWVNAMQYLPPMKAFEQAVTAWMEPNEARQLTDVADTYFK